MLIKKGGFVRVDANYFREQLQYIKFWPAAIDTPPPIRSKIAIMFGGNAVVMELPVRSGVILGCSPAGDKLNQRNILNDREEKDC